MDQIPGDPESYHICWIYMSYVSPPNSQNMAKCTIIIIHIYPLHPKNKGHPYKNTCFLFSKCWCIDMAVDTQFHVLAVDDSIIDRKLIERLLKTSSFQGRLVHL